MWLLHLYRWHRWHGGAPAQTHESLISHVLPASPPPSPPRPIAGAALFSKNISTRSPSFHTSRHHLLQAAVPSQWNKRISPPGSRCPLLHLGGRPAGEAKQWEQQGLPPAGPSDATCARALSVACGPQEEPRCPGRLTGDEMGSPCMGAELGLKPGRIMTRKWEQLRQN